jgi:predicted secreted protein
MPINKPTEFCCDIFKTLSMLGRICRLCGHPDTVVMAMVMERSGPDAAVPTQQVNKVMADAVREAKALSGVEVSTGNFSTYPQYDNKGNLIGWTVRSELVLKGRDFAVNSESVKMRYC